MSGHEDAGMQRENVDGAYARRGQAAQDSDSGTRDSARDRSRRGRPTSSYAAEPGLTRFWSWRVPMMKEKLRILHKEHALQAEAVRKMREKGDEERGEEEEDREDREEMPPQQQQRDPREAKCEPVPVDLLGAGGEGAAEQQLQRQQQLQQPREQWQQSGGCSSCREDKVLVPLLVPSPEPPQRSPPPPSMPRLLTSSQLARPSNVRHMPESVGPLCGGEGGEQESERDSWPAGAGGEVETGRAGWNAYGQNSLPGLLRPFARGLLTRDVAPDEGEGKRRDGSWRGSLHHRLGG